MYGANSSMLHDKEKTGRELTGYWAPDINT